MKKTNPIIRMLRVSYPALIYIALLMSATLSLVEASSSHELQLTNDSSELPSISQSGLN